MATPRVPSCNFIKAAIRELSLKNVPLDESYAQLNESFQELKGLDKASFSRAWNKIKDIFNGKGWKKPEHKKKFLDHFGLSKWKALTQREKNNHKIDCCVQCWVKHSEIHALFPQKSKEGLLLEKEEANVHDSLQVFLSTLKNKNVGIIQGADLLLHVVSKSYSNVFSKNLHETLVKHITIVDKENVRPFPCQIKEKYQRQFRDDVQEIVRAKDLSNVLAVRQSFNQMDKKRKLTYFESADAARQRVTQRKKDENEGVVKKKRNSPDPANVEFDKEGMMAKVDRLFESEENPTVSKANYFRSLSILQFLT